MALRITISQSEEAVTLRLEGRITGPWVDELRRAWSELAPGETQVRIDLREVTYSDQQGTAVLKDIYAKTGAEMLTSSPWTQHLAATIRSN